MENFDLDDIVMQVRVQELRKLLIQTQYDIEETEFLVNGFSRGFDIGYKGPNNRQSKAKNIPLRVGSEIELWNKIIKEVKLK